MKIFNFFTTLICIIFLHDAYAITIGTYNAPPFSMNEDGEDIGMVTDSVRKLLNRSDIKQYQIVNYPVARGLAELKLGRIDIYYPFFKNFAQPNDKYVLIGPIAKYKVALFVRKDYPDKVSIASMQNLVIGAERDGIGSLVLEQKNIQVEPASQNIGCLRMVVAKRLVACATGTLPGMYVAALNGMYKEVRYVETDAYADIYVALRENLDPELITKIQRAYADLKRGNYFTAQQQEYEHKFTMFIKSLS